MSELDMNMYRFRIPATPKSYYYLLKAQEESEAINQFTKLLKEQEWIELFKMERQKISEKAVECTKNINYFCVKEINEKTYGRMIQNETI
ncbi:MAG TPA: hypothetical protein ENI23_10810 [bacterium]|nr:hypothetical protein [bacterium]